MDELLKSISEHIASYGYHSQIEDGILKVSHETRAHFWVLPSNAGVLFRTLFATGPIAQENPADFLKFLSDANNLSTVGRYTVRDNLLSIEAWFPNCYDRAVFAAFFDQYLAEIRAPVEADRASIERFFPG
jgi:hypothetical protein